LKPVVGVVGDMPEPNEAYEFVPYRRDVPVDAVLSPVEIETPEWLPVVADPRDLKRAIRRWAFTIEEAQDVRGPGTVVWGTLANARLRMGETAVKEGFERSMRIREIRVDGRTVQSAEPGDEVALAFGPVPISLFRKGGVLRPGRPAQIEPKAAPNRDVKEAILAAVGDDPAGRGTAAILKALDRTPQQLGDAFEALKREGRLLGFAGQWINPRAFDQGADRLIEALDMLHARNPAQPSQPVAKVLGAAHLSWSGKPLERILARLVEKGAIARREDEIRRPGFRVKLGDRQRGFLDRVVSLLDESGVNPPNAHELGKRLPAPAQAVSEVLALGEDVGEIVELADGVIFTTQGLLRLRERVRDGAGGRPFTLGEMRDSLGASRRVAVALLERFDAEGFTERQGEKRIVKPT